MITPDEYRKINEKHLEDQRKYEISLVDDLLKKINEKLSLGYSKSFSESNTKYSLETLNALDKELNKSGWYITHFTTSGFYGATLIKLHEIKNKPIKRIKSWLGL